MLERLDVLHLESGKRKPVLVAERILEAIRRGDYPPGTRLPSERWLAEHLRVSRGVVREALSALQIAGVIVIRAGDGAYVRDTQPGSRERALALLEHASGPLEVWEARREVEVAVCCLALQKSGLLQRPPQELHPALADVERAFHALERYSVSGDAGEYLRANREFHLAFARMTDNGVLIKVMQQLLDLTDHVLTRHLTELYLGKGLEASLDKHRAIYDAFRKGDEEALRRAIRHHFDELERFLVEGEW